MASTMAWFQFEERWSMLGWWQATSASVEGDDGGAFGGVGGCQGEEKARKVVEMIQWKWRHRKKIKTTRDCEEKLASGTHADTSA